MRAYRINRFGGVDGVVPASRDVPQPRTREILIRVRATSLNYRDLMVLKGGGRGPTRLGVVPLSDGAGEVVGIGAGASRFAIGGRVIPCFHPRWFGGPIKPDYLKDRLGANMDGMLAEYAVVYEEAAVAMPSHLSFEEAATLPCAAVTAWVALTGHYRVTAGDTVLTQGTGGVAIFALQFAQLLRARVIAITSSAAKAERLRALQIHRRGGPRIAGAISVDGPAVRRTAAGRRQMNVRLWTRSGPCTRSASIETSR